MHKRFVRQVSLIPLAVFCLVNNAVALSPPAPVRMPADFSLDLALQAAQASLAECNKINEKVAVGVVDRDEHIRVLLYADGGYSMDWLLLIQRMAHTVLKTGMSSGDYGKSLNSYDINPTISADRDLQVKSGRTPILLGMTPGAVPIMKNGVMVGAVSVAGNNPRGTRFGYEPMGPVEPCAIAGRDVIEAGIKNNK